jgi:hypothetical protein
MLKKHKTQFNSEKSINGKLCCGQNKNRVFFRAASSKFCSIIFEFAFIGLFKKRFFFQQEIKLNYIKFY